MASFSVTHNKRKTKVLGYGQDHKVGFRVVTMNHRLICLARFIVAKAVADKAFENEYTSIEDVLRRFTLEDVNYVRLKWKSDVNDSPIFSLNYKRFWKT